MRSKKLLNLIEKILTSAPSRELTRDSSKYVLMLRDDYLSTLTDKQREIIKENLKKPPAANAKYSINGNEVTAESIYSLQTAIKNITKGTRGSLIVDDILDSNSSLANIGSRLVQSVSEVDKELSDEIAEIFKDSIDINISDNINEVTIVSTAASKRRKIYNSIEKEKIINEVLGNINSHLLKNMDSITDDVIDSIDENLSTLFMTGKVVTPVAAIKNRFSVRTKKVKGKANKYVLANVRDPKTGRFISKEDWLPTISKLLNSMLTQKVASLMEHSAAPSSEAYLRYQTGRFAESAKVSSVSLLGGRSNKIQIFYRYMYNPYSTFSPSNGGRQASIGRDPNRYIVTAIKDILKESMGKAFIDEAFNIRGSK